MTVATELPASGADVVEAEESDGAPPVGLVVEDAEEDSPLWPFAKAAPPSPIFSKTGIGGFPHVPWTPSVGGSMTSPAFPGLGIFKIPSLPPSPAHSPGMLAAKMFGSVSKNASSSAPPVILIGAQFLQTICSVRNGVGV